MIVEEKVSRCLDVILAVSFIIYIVIQTKRLTFVLAAKTPIY
jgi:hypothetical protein